MDGHEDESTQADSSPSQHPLKLFDLAKSEGRFLCACAPMVRYSKLAFRQTVHAYGTDLCWTPMILAKEFNRSSIARDSDFTYSTTKPRPPTIVQFGANVPLELARASSLVVPYADGVDINCGCPQSWACAETLGAALMEKRELVRDMVLETRQRLRDEGWAVGKERDMDNAKGRTVSVKIRVHKDLRKTIDFIDTVLGHDKDRNIDFLTIHPRTRNTPSTTPINLEALELLTEKYGDSVPILVSGDVFSMASLPYRSPYLAPRDDDDDNERRRPYLSKLRGLMSARALLANPALFAGYEACPWEAVELFMNNVVRAPLPLKLVQHHLGEMCAPGYGPDKHALLSKKERAEMYNCTDMCALVDFMDEKMRALDRRDGIRRDLVPSVVQTI
ncbi:FMN-linked oxidoreductase [Cryphonectria parasitica EP155]|uniref:FMN-linked oxidoreductase n=1 Tax=Cryphonectria parasitica (strain ATCC 38755 / EP155) TaxID=660469 RepID=A0A9P4XXE4_CRYP1|nr:FMN-linked oxidoreductase [Cryphonectria parasitica EP155]KAF3762520.1 FMN-linked oxidoreductase [Cryphonectria parasitica EP155]